MKREFLQGLNLEKDAIDSIMAEHGRDIQELQSKLEGYADYDDMKSQNAELTSQVEALTGERDTAKTEAEELKTEVQKYKVADMKRSAASKYGLSSELAKRLSGEDEESIDKDAKALSETLKQTRRTTLHMNNNEPAKDVNAPYKKMLDDLKGEE